jgi:hypothetical protein
MAGTQPWLALMMGSHKSPVLGDCFRQQAVCDRRISATSRVDQSALYGNEHIRCQQPLAV